MKSWSRNIVKLVGGGWQAQFIRLLLTVRRNMACFVTEPKISNADNDDDDEHAKVEE